MNKIIAVAVIAALAGLHTLAQDMRWPMKTVETINQARGGRGGRGGAPAPDPANAVTRDRLANVIVKLSKTNLGVGNEVITLKHAPPVRGTTSGDLKEVTIPFADKEKLMDGLKETLADFKKMTSATTSDRKEIYANPSGTFKAVTIRDGHKKFLEVTFKDANDPTLFELPQQQVELFFNLLKNLK